MQFIPGHFCCDVVWNTMINVHPRLKMGPNMGVSRGETRFSLLLLHQVGQPRRKEELELTSEAAP